MRRKIMLMAVASVLMVAVLAGCKAVPEELPPVKEELPPVKIGFLSPMTGSAKSVGDAMQMGFWYAVNEINDEGGILGGRMVEGRLYDEGSGDVEVIVAGVKKAVADGVVGISGHYASTGSVMTRDVAREARIIMCAQYGAMEALQDGYGGLFKYNPATGQDVAPIARFLEEQGVKTIVTIQGDHAWERSVNKVFHDLWDRPGSPIEIVDEMWFPFGPADLSSEYVRALAHNPDAIFVGVHSDTGYAAAFRGAYEQGFEGIHITSVSTMLAHQAAAGGVMAEGSLQGKNFISDPTVPTNKAFVDKVARDHGIETPYLTVISHDSTKSMLLAIDKAGTDTDVDAIARALHTLDYTMVDGSKLGFYPNGQREVQKVAFCVVDDGLIVLDRYLDVLPSDVDL